jgi:hypothetical protein
VSRDKWMMFANTPFAVSLTAPPRARRTSPRHVAPPLFITNILFPKPCNMRPSHTRMQGPKIQRLVTANRLQRKRSEKSDKIKRGEATKAASKEYAKLKAERTKEAKAQRREKSSRRASSTVKSQ